MQRYRRRLEMVFDGAGIGCRAIVAAAVAAVGLVLGWQLSAGAGRVSAAEDDSASGWMEIRVLDEATGRGVPLVELETVNGLRFVTDNAGRVALNEPDWNGEKLFFGVRSHGYETPRDGFGSEGVVVTPRVGEVAEIRLRRTMLAERVCRLTGEGLDRDTLLLGYPPLRPASRHPGRVAGQDSIQAARFQGRLFWFWGDTQRMSYPLGLFRMAGATTNIPAPEDVREFVEHGIAYDYFVNPETGFARAMMPLAERPEGVVWIAGVCVVPDENGVERMVAHYSRRKNLEEEIEQGIAVFDPERAEFDAVAQLPLNETWRRPGGHPIEFEDQGKKWLLMGSPNPNVRVPATMADVSDPSKYESWTARQGASNEDLSRVAVKADGSPNWRWSKGVPPVDSRQESRWVTDGTLRADDCRYYPVDALGSGERVVLHSGSVRWNAHRKRWILVAGQIEGRSSLLGEVWYSESDSPLGPFSKAVKVVTHDRMSFYNVCHHASLDVDGGRVIHFEGTYTRDFSGVETKTPRYNYNQVLYRLDLDAVSPYFESAGSP